jgi:octaprenyl-diphosphate synthase
MKLDKDEMMKVVYQPISQNLVVLKQEMNHFVNEFEGLSIGEVYKYFFNRQGKFLRPALFFLSAGIAGGHQVFEKNRGGYQLALALELLHSASLIHDDVLDGDDMRRGQVVLNKRFNNQIAILAGDTLFSKVYSIVAIEFDSDYACKIADLSHSMCLAEVEQAMGVKNRDQYIKVILGKTAVFTKTCCELGAMVAGASSEEIELHGRIGYNFGMAYQMYDDLRDRDPNIVGNGSVEDVKNFVKCGLDALNQCDDSSYKSSLKALIESMESRL